VEELCPTSGFGISGVETSGFNTSKELAVTQLK
jgi:hypothetical protein